MRRSLAAIVLSLVVVAPLLWAEDAAARAGRGGSSGSRGSRSYSSPAPASPAPSTTGRATTAPAARETAPARGGWGALGGFLAGGLLGGLLFGGAGSGMGLSDVVVLALLASFAWKLLHTGAPSPAPTFAGVDGAGGADARWRSLDRADPPVRPGDLDAGLDEVRPIDASFDKAAFAEIGIAMFTKVEEAWSARDVRPIAALLTPEMQVELQRDCAQMTAKGRVNRLDDIAIRAADVVEAWQEKGHDHVTLRLEASRLDYTTDDTTGQVIEGSASQPVTVEEFWTFTRPVWAKTWRLSAIQQPVPAGH